METNKLGFLCLFFLFISPFPVLAIRTHLQKPLDDQATLKTYIVHVQLPDGVFASSDDRATWYRSFLPVRTANAEEPRMVYAYNSVVSGFAARLSEGEAKAMQDKEGFLSARPDRVLKTQTTRSPDFMGLVRGAGFWPYSGFGKGVIVGLFDTGILPSHPSFSDSGMPAPPAKWKGVCEFNSSDCNNKLIGLRGFNSGAASMGLAVGGGGGAGVAAVPNPYDEDGHGTHTASTATGRFIAGAEVLDNANGTAVGMAPLAHVAMYKVCYGEACAESDILAGMDAAVEDGVDVMSLSLGGPATNFFDDNIAIAGFSAMEKGIFVSCSAGNSGPNSMTLSNEAPWILTVGASSIDRTILATVKLGNGAEYQGESLFQPSNVTLQELVYPGAGGNAEAATCADTTLGGQDVKGKIVLCDRGGNVGRIAKGEAVKAAGGAGMILANTEVDGFSTIADPHVLPASHVSFVDGVKIKAYLNASSGPTAGLVFEGTMLGTRPAPVLASFSSRGPSFADPNILKPDIIGPGLSILAAWPFPVEPTSTTVSGSPATFNIISGTSMSCPHLSGIAALLTAVHPEWSPAAIKSAIMTTAYVVGPDGLPILDQNHNPADLFAVGAGHVDPTRASNPGLVYDIEPVDYIKYLCGLGYSNVQVSTVVRQQVQCSDYGSIAAGDLNYPTFSVMMTKAPVTFNRTATNVGAANSVYDVTVVAPKGVKVDVEPLTLEFAGVGESKSYSVTFSLAAGGGAPPTSSFAAGYLKWVSGIYGVRSSISVTFT